MSITNCRGDKAKLDIVSNYDIKPVVYVRLLSGQKINGCCGPITDKYYLFEAENKQTKDIDTFCVGYDCGDQLLQLINHNPLQLFDPFQAQYGGQGGGNGGEAQQLHPLNKELRNAIHILCSAWGGKAPKAGLRKFLEYINKNPSRPTNSFAITSFNRIVSKDAKGRTLTQIIGDIRLKNPNLRNFSFPLMEQVLKDEKQTSNL
ncbi:hypothetical protein [Neptuniibacter marinus]|uniref:hypothetical protein n=1 Tax=Neptuniibacter marinus TaxID=1806670 RepID=UPI00082AE613|nr:hypothetical protein [Neptuniibacter marinus]